MKNIAIFVYRIQIPHVTCQNYLSRDLPKVEDCSKPDINLCRDCTWPPPNPGDTPNCWAKKNFTRSPLLKIGPLSMEMCRTVI